MVPVHSKRFPVSLENTLKFVSAEFQISEKFLFCDSATQVESLWTDLVQLVNIARVHHMKDSVRREEPWISAQRTRDFKFDKLSLESRGKLHIEARVFLAECICCRQKRLHTLRRVSTLICVLVFALRRVSAL